MKIDVCTTATYRPELLERTFCSFKENLFLDEHEYRLVINVDPVGSDTKKEVQVIRVCDKYFRFVKANFPKQPHFGHAFVWCWQNVETPIVFHLEEDWELMQKVDVNHMLQMFTKYPTLASLRLNMFKSVDGVTKNWSHFHKHNGDFFPIPPEEKGLLGWCGHPGFTTLHFIKTVIPHINPERNPEKQIKGHNSNFGHLFRDHEFGVYSPPNSPPVVRDIGRRWMVENGYAKKGKNKAIFTVWRKL